MTALSVRGIEGTRTSAISAIASTVTFANAG
jgi:hypothetical protein